MDEQKRKVFNFIAEFPDGATVLDLCQVGLFAADVVAALDILIAQGWVERRGSVYVTRSPRVVSIRQAIDLHLGVKREYE